MSEIPEPYQRLLLSPKALSVLSSLNNPDIQQCLQNLFREIRLGEIKMYPHPSKKSLYLPKLACNHAIIAREWKNDIYIIDIYPYDIPPIE